MSQRGPTRRYRLYVDESGDHAYGQSHILPHRYLALCGVIVEFHEYRLRLQPELEALKQRHLPHSPDDPIVLHRKDILNARGPFKPLRDPARRMAFDQDLLAFLYQHDFAVIAVVIDKWWHWQHHGKLAWHPYHYCMDALLERYCGWLRHIGAVGDVMAESRGGREDRQLKNAFVRLCSMGTYYHPASFFASVLTSRQLKLKPKSANIAGLQIADILAHPLRGYVLQAFGINAFTLKGFGRAVVQAVQGKILANPNNGKREGFGLKKLP